MGTGWIAERFVTALRAHTRQLPHAVGSRNPGSAAAFAADHGLPVAHGSYEHLLGDPSVDVIYVATPHSHHLEAALATIAAGKHVVVEKPLGVNADEAERIASAAREQGVYCVEALWTLFLPKFDVLRQVLDDGAVGEPLSVVADLGDWFDDSHRIRRADLAGGAMLDLGTYPVSLATWVLGEPADVAALAARTGDVTAQFGAVLRSPVGAIASLFSSIDSITPTTAMIAGTEGGIILDGPFFMPGRFVVRDRRGPPLVWDEPAVGHQGLHFEAAAVARDLAEGRTESSVRPLRASIETLRTMDRITAAG
ncbi:Gfo/Idh/MocA family oxidoreductase [Angustibacter luteus]